MGYVHRPGNDNRRLLIFTALISLGCLCIGYQSETTGADPFFATEGTSRATSVPGADAHRVSKGSGRPSVAVKRGARVTPANDGGKRIIDKSKQFTFEEFRNFGYRQPGASKAVGAARRP
jgi:hypothetical protein